MKTLSIVAIILFLIISCVKEPTIIGKWNIDGFEPTAKNIAEDDKFGLLLLQLAQAQMPGKVEFQHNNKLIFFDKQDKPVSSGTYKIGGEKGVIITTNDTTEILVETKTENELVFLTADSIRIHLSK